MMSSRIAVSMMLLCALLAGAAPLAAQARPLNESDHHFIKELVVAEVWRPGGADANALAEVLAGILRSGNYEAASWLVREATPFVYRRLLDPAPLAAVANEVGVTDSSVAGAEWRETAQRLGRWVEVSRLSQQARFALYHKLIAAREVNGAIGLSYAVACVRGLWEDPREFLAEAESTCPAGAALRVAHARTDPFALDALLDLIETAVNAELRQSEPVDGIAPDELLNEALLGLLMDKQAKAISRLKKIWLAIPVPTSPNGRTAEIRADLAARGRWDTEPPRDNLPGRYLMRAIRGFGDTSFQSKNLKFNPSLLPDPKSCRDALQDRGLYQPEKE